MPNETARATPYFVTASASRHCRCIAFLIKGGTSEKAITNSSSIGSCLMSLKSRGVVVNVKRDDPVVDCTYGIHHKSRHAPKSFVPKSHLPTDRFAASSLRAMTPDLSLRTHNTALRRLWTLAGMLFIVLTVVVSLWPMPAGGMHSHVDKLVHILGYNALMLWFTQVVPSRQWPRLGLALFLLGVSIELLQGQTAYRRFSLLDIVANSIGIATGWLLALHGGSKLLERIERRLAPGTGSG